MMRKWLVLPVLALLLLLGWLAAGPWLAYDGIRKAVAAKDTAALSRHVDFPLLRSNLRAQAEDYLATRAGPVLGDGTIGAFAMRAASGLAGGAIDAVATPAGVGALLQGRSLWHRASGGGIVGEDSWDHAAPADPLQEPRYRLESLSRFTATVEPRPGAPVTLVLSRQGLRWRLTDIILAAD